MRSESTVNTFESDTKANIIAMSDASDRALFEAWMKDHNKHYKDADEKEMRFNVFQCNLRQREVELKEYDKEARLEYLTGLMDITAEEYRRNLCGGVDDSDDSSDDEFTKTVTDVGFMYSLRGHEKEDTEDELMETSMEEDVVKQEEGRYSCDEIKDTKEEDDATPETMIKPSTRLEDVTSLQQL